MLPPSKIASDVTAPVPADVAQLRFAAYIDEGVYPDEAGFLTRVERSVDAVETMTRMSLRRATYTCEWPELPEAPRADRDRPLTFPGLNGSVTSFEWVEADGTGTPIAADLWTTLPPTEAGSVRVVPTDPGGRWTAIERIERGSGIPPRGYRVVGTAGCDTSGAYPMHGDFFEGLALILRHRWLTLPEAQKAAETVMSRWCVAGSSL